MARRRSRRRRSRSRSRSRSRGRGRKGKRGSKKNPFSSKAKCMRSTRKGSKYYKRKGRTLKFKKGRKKRR